MAVISLCVCLWVHRSAQSTRGDMLNAKASECHFRTTRAIERALMTGRRPIAAKFRAIRMPPAITDEYLFACLTKLCSPAKPNFHLQEQKFPENN
jgi:hypothetical protein